MTDKDLIGTIAEFKDDPDRWGIIKSFSDAGDYGRNGECVYLQTFGTCPSGSFYIGVDRSLLRFCAENKTRG